MPNTPFIQYVPYQAPEQVLLKCPQQNLVWLDSSRLEHEGRFSYLCVDPIEVIRVHRHKVNGQPVAKPFAYLKSILKAHRLDKHPDGPDFQGGLAGLFSYDCYRYIEPYEFTSEDDAQYPDMMLGHYDLVFAFDCIEQTLCIVSTGFAGDDSESRAQRAHKRIQWAQALLQGPSKPYPIFEQSIQFTPNCPKSVYLEQVERTMEYIRAGDIFEANFTQRFYSDTPELDTLGLYYQLRAANRAPFAAYLRFDNLTIMSASPERFLKASQGDVQAKPIKGTTKRSKDPFDDDKRKRALIDSEKDWAENVMIVDLMRNDLSKVCQPGTVQVPTLCGLESFETVHHLVSTVEGQLKQDLCITDLLEATFPGGSITGAPKIRAVEIIDELETHVRGPYCGSAGFLSVTQDMDLSILIRTLCYRNDRLTLAAGGAITIDSNPEHEYEESYAKVQVIMDLLNA